MSMDTDILDLVLSNRSASDSGFQSENSLQLHVPAPEIDNPFSHDFSGAILCTGNIPGAVANSDNLKLGVDQFSDSEPVDCTSLLLSHDGDSQPLPLEIFKVEPRLLDDGTDSNSAIFTFRGLHEQFDANVPLGSNVAKKTLAITEDSIECQLCRDIVLKDGLLEHYRFHNCRQCFVCGKESASKGDLMKHFILHTGIRPLACNICGKTFPLKGSLAKHVRTHLGEREFACELCDACFSRKEHLKWHLTSKHSDERPYKCALCPATFNRPYVLRLHMITHTNNKEHECSFCRLKTASKSDLNKHMRVHTGEKPYLCEECGKAFAWPHSLRNHQKMHRGLKDELCGVCGAQFTTKEGLRKHQTTHTDEKPFICECGKTFALAVYLKAHRVSHQTDDAPRPFSCSGCERGFKTKGDLVKHSATHSGFNDNANCE